jgi:hypothetical protein
MLLQNLFGKCSDAAEERKQSGIPVNRRYKTTMIARNVGRPKDA